MNGKVVIEIPVSPSDAQDGIEAVMHTILRNRPKLGRVPDKQKALKFLEELRELGTVTFVEEREG